MKNLSITQKIILLVNYIFALLLLIAFAVPYLPPKYTSVLSFSSLVFPVLVLINILFVLYWLVKLKKQLLVSTLALLINFNNIQALYQWEGKNLSDDHAFSVMSYNVRLFNTYKWIHKKGIDVDISNYIKDQSPDILCLQEFKKDVKTDFSQYKYQHIILKGQKRKAGLALFSKYKIIDKGDLKFDHTYNNTIWSDIIIRNDTVRIYNIHLQSFKIKKPEDLVNNDKHILSQKLIQVFQKQYEQAKIIQKHIEQSPYPVIVTGDFNNTAFSSPYKVLVDGKNDAFVEAGQGFGITWQYKWLPLRIDFILPDEKIKVLKFETLNYIKLSDHYPIKAWLLLD
ncbi:MAG TPA: endonuclease [Flavobacteriales bacterium]|nr:endonuclease [Flavobacteriales bacterium]